MWECDAMEDPKRTRGDALLDAALGNALQVQALCSPWVLWRKERRRGVFGSTRGRVVDTGMTAESGDLSWLVRWKVAQGHLARRRKR